MVLCLMRSRLSQSYRFRSDAWNFHTLSITKGVLSDAYLILSDDIGSKFTDTVLDKAFFPLYDHSKRTGCGLVSTRSESVVGGQALVIRLCNFYVDLKGLFPGCLCNLIGFNLSQSYLAKTAHSRLQNHFHILSNSCWN